VVFGLFEAAMPVVGLVLGRSLAGKLAGTAPLVGGVAVALVGAYSIAAALLARKETTIERGTGTGRLVGLAVVLSIDNLVIGFALGTYHVNFVAAVVVIAVVSVSLSLLGFELGNRVGARLGKRSELVGGAALVIVGVAISLGFR